MKNKVEEEVKISKDVKEVTLSNSNSKYFYVRHHIVYVIQMLL